jgi:hypothetical protein
MPKIALSQCPTCKRELDACTTATGLKLLPVEDDISVCIYCGSINQYNEDLTLRLMPTQVFADLPKEQRVLLSTMVDGVHELREDKGPKQ